MVQYAYDPKCEELAKYFLDDEPDVTVEDVQDLAQSIQDTVETFVGARK